VHPPLGKLLIAAGIRVFGFTPVGWRFAALVAGVAVVGLSAAVVHRLTGRPRLACAAGLLVAFDGVMFTTGRLAMLDVYGALFVMLATWFLARAWSAAPAEHRVRRWSGVGATVAASLGGSVKWSALWILPVVAVVLCILDWRTRAAGRPRRKAVAVTVALAVLLPLPIYLATWIPRAVGPARLTPSQFVQQQREVAEFHLKLRPSNSNASSGVTWLWLEDPTRLYRETCEPEMSGQPTRVCPRHGGQVTEVRILSLANPFVWVTGLAGVLGLVGLLVRRRRGVAAWLLALAATQWVPWIINPRAAYTFYQASLIPLLVVGAAVSFAATTHRRWRRSAVVVLLAAFAGFAFFYPLWVGRPLSPAAYALRMWLPRWV
jgi:dolichyl-phosphate-mannose--protein O-mannosyl transferase